MWQQTMQKFKKHKVAARENKGWRIDLLFKKAFSDLTPAIIVKLLLSILIDLIGMATYAIPGIAEVGDIAWAPISAGLVFCLYGNSMMAVVNFAEEILPATDFFPSATAAWLWERLSAE